MTSEFHTYCNAYSDMTQQEPAVLFGPAAVPTMQVGAEYFARPFLGDHGY